MLRTPRLEFPWVKYGYFLDPNIEDCCPGVLLLLVRFNKNDKSTVETKFLELPVKLKLVDRVALGPGDKSCGNFQGIMCVIH